MVFKFPKAHWMYKIYPTTRVDKMIPRMRYEIPVDPIKVRGGEEWRRQLFGKQMRLETIARSVNDLVRDERIHLTYYKAWEVRNYAERLIMEAIRYGDCHRPTMELADFYLKEKNLIHKLFKVLVPRYMHYSESFTAMHLLPLETSRTLNTGTRQEGKSPDLNQEAILELRGNPLPSVRNPSLDSQNFLTNVLLRAAKREYENNKRDKGFETKH